MDGRMTIAEFVQQVWLAVYGVRLDVEQGINGAYHSKTDKFKEVVMSGNFVRQELQYAQDWNWLRDRWEMGYAHNPDGTGIAEFKLPEDAYKVCTGYNDAVRLHNRHNPNHFSEVLWTSPRSGNHHNVAMFDEYGRHNVPDKRLQAFVVNDIVTFTRPFTRLEIGSLVETDIIRRMQPLHLCTDECPDDCPRTYKEKVFGDISDPYYMIVATAVKRAEFDPAAQDRIQPLTDNMTKLMSAMRENDSAHTVPDTYRTSELGFIEVL